MLLSLLENHETGKTMKDIALSILGNCCMDEKCRKEVLWKEGIPIICKLKENLCIDLDEFKKFIE